MFLGKCDKSGSSIQTLMDQALIFYSSLLALVLPIQKINSIFLLFVFTLVHQTIFAVSTMFPVCPFLIPLAFQEFQKDTNLFLLRFEISNLKTALKEVLSILKQVFFGPMELDLRLSLIYQQLLLTELGLGLKHSKLVSE